MTIVAVTGTPGTGKTTYSLELAKTLSADYIDVNKIIEKYNLAEFYDKDKDCKVVDEDKLVEVLITLINNAKEEGTSLVIDSHLSHEVPAKYIDKCIVMRTPIERLRPRLKARGYSDEKVQENIEAEIFEIILNEVREQGHEVEIHET